MTFAPNTSLNFWISKKWKTKSRVKNLEKCEKILQILSILSISNTAESSKLVRSTIKKSSFSKNLFILFLLL